ncbi:MAG: TrkA C-terminal domain-containing protein [Candidatus Omnitrophota bacterium]
MGMISAVIPLIGIVIIFFFIVRIATVILKFTGLDEQTANFQAISAFTGTGFTTKEAETILEDKVRRKTIIVLMVFGKIGIVSLMGGVFLSFGKNSLGADLWKVFTLLAIVFTLYKIISLKGFSRALNKIIEKGVVARGIVQQKALEELFHLPKGYGLTQLNVVKNSKECGLSLAEAGFIKKDILILSIERKNKLISFPHAQDTIKEDDKLLCYGLIKNVKSYI